MRQPASVFSNFGLLMLLMLFQASKTNASLSLSSTEQYKNTTKASSTIANGGSQLGQVTNLNTNIGAGAGAGGSSNSAAAVVGAVTAVPVAPAANPITTTRRPLLQGLKLPCSCRDGHCGCCSGMILERFRQKACMNLTYDPDEFAVTAAMSMNERVLYKNTFSGKNPDPMCIRVPRFRFVEFCVEFSNIYFAKRNIHMCIDAEASWEDFTLVEWSFDCIRLGASGLAVLGPEEGGGLPLPSVDEEDQVDEDYDDNARNVPLNPSDKYTVEKLPDGYVRIDFNKS